MKKLFVASAATIGLGLGSVVLAAEGTITITGEVSDKTCTINQGSGDKLVPLSNIAMSSLPAGQVSGVTPFTLEFSGCSATKVRAHFEPGGNVDAATGDLKNTQAGGSNVQVRILNDAQQHIDLRNNSNSQQVEVTGGSATLLYHAAYMAPAGEAVTAGGVKTTVEYSMDYE
ncbi:fimbrial protein [Pseudomonas sp. PDM13]|uniref:fimbrial protein n=1 Tax=Pseudomonas sp. PDM13 TaxID=2769255 RepID=UPI0021E0CE18|nr:fimbrial protein [Pseudomonas sp. PDM13]MCU9948208.1 type 1 fimbrial protein [Pseudomonas sp. PDM13]